MRASFVSSVSFQASILVAAAVAAVAIFGLASCTAQADGDRAACDKVNAELSSCLGSGDAPIDCSAASPGDIERLSAVTSNGACSFLADSFPLDGDPKGASCRLFSVGCVNPTTPEPKAGPSKYPIVLVNGIDTSPLFRYSDRIVQVMKDAGYDVALATLTPYEPPKVRAPELHARIQEILAATGAAKVNLVCHSLGGLDCRYLVSDGGAHWDLGIAQAEIAAQIASITTIGTAHRGTKVADQALGLLPGVDKDSAIETFATLAGDWFSAGRIDTDVHLRDALAALSEANAPAFNAEIVDAKGIYYQSWAGVSSPRGNASATFDAAVADECAAATLTSASADAGATAALALAADIAPTATARDWMALPLVPFTMTLGVDVPSDGLTTVHSAKWGHFQGCIPADHMEQLGQKNLPDANVETGFDIARFYGGVAASLAERGF